MWMYINKVIKLRKFRREAVGKLSQQVLMLRSLKAISAFDV